jgi:hypothetical protein
MAQPLIFDFYNEIILVPAPDNTLEMQYLIDQVRDTEDNLTPGIGYNQIAEAAGKFDLGGGIYTGITVKLLGNWRVKFEDRPGPTIEIMTVTGGNLVGGPGGAPIAAAANVQVIQQSSAASTIAVPSAASETTNIKYLVAALSETHKAVGNIYYWNPVSGNDNSVGLAPGSAFRTFAKCHAMVIPGNQDIVFAMAADPSGQTTVTEPIIITKDGMKLRGPGYVFRLIPNVLNSPGITITGDNVEISGFYVASDPSGTSAVSIMGNDCLIKDNWFGGSQNHNIQVSNSKLTRIQNCVIEHAAFDAIHLANSATQCIIRRCIISDSVNGVSMTGTGLSDNVVENCLIYMNSGYGITIGPDVERTTVRSGNTIVNNATGNTRDNGNNTFIEIPAGGATATEIADAVWEEVIAGHTATPGAAAKVLKDIKTKATLSAITK